MMKWYKYFCAKNLNQQSDCIVSNPRIFKDKAIQVLLRQKIWIVKAIVSLQTPEFLKMKRYKYFYSKKIWINKAIVSLQNSESFSDEAIQLVLLLLPGGMSGFTDLILR